MERKIGETFEYEGKKLMVVETIMGTCLGCVFKDKCNCKDVWKIVGVCSASSRTDKKQVIIVESPVKPAPQEEQKLNLLEKLRYCPEGEEFWSPLLGDVKFICVGKSTIAVEDKKGCSWDINPDSTITIDDITSAEPMLYPSKEQRDWSKVEYKQPIDKLPKSWEEFCETHEVQKGEAYIDDCCNILGEEETGDTRDVSNDRNILPSKQACRQHLALMQLHQLRDCWRDGWKPEPCKERWAITKDSRGVAEVNNFKDISVFLSFQDEERAELFVQHFRNLIERAGDLI